MESGSQSGRSASSSQNRVAQFVGTAIALLTLTLPLLVIFVYSTDTVGLPSSLYPLSRLGDRTGGYTNQYVE